MRPDLIAEVVIDRARRGLTTELADLAWLTDEYGRERDLERREAEAAEAQAAVRDANARNEADREWLEEREARLRDR